MALPPIPLVVHPLVVHFVIALVPTVAALASFALWRRAEWAARAALLVLAAAAAFAVLAVALGFVDYFAAAPALEGTPARDLIEWHERLGVVTGAVVVGTALVAWWRRRHVTALTGWTWALAAATWAATGLVLLTAWFGGGGGPRVRQRRGRARALTRPGGRHAGRTLTAWTRARSSRPSVASPPRARPPSRASRSRRPSRGRASSRRG